MVIFSLKNKAQARSLVKNKTIQDGKKKFVWIMGAQRKDKDSCGIAKWWRFTYSKKDQYARDHWL